MADIRWTNLSVPERIDNEETRRDMPERRAGQRRPSKQRCSHGDKNCQGDYPETVARVILISCPSLPSAGQPEVRGRLVIAE